MEHLGRNGWLFGAWALLLVGALLRINNALHFPVDMGFDATGNWDYIQRLLKDWRLPLPEERWSTSHPPLFYYLSAAIGRLLDDPGKRQIVVTLRLLSSAAGLIIVGLAVALVRRLDPGNARRVLLCAALLLFLPVHIYMSAMLSEEMLVSFLISAMVAGFIWLVPNSARLGHPRSPPGSIAAALGLGAVAGLALLTKLTGLIAIGAGAVAYLSLVSRREPGPALARCLAFGAAASLVGGWFYLYNLFQFGYLYPYGLEMHSVMFEMPPESRGIADYLRFPLSTFSNPNLLSADLLHSVWGSTFITLWFEAHGHYLPVDDALLTRLVRLMLVLAVIPTFAFLAGMLRGVRRVWKGVAGPDLLLLTLVLLTLLGYVAFSWRNPQFVSLKASFLLGLALPWAVYASEVLADWTRGPRIRSLLVWASLVLLGSLVTATYSYGLVFAKSGLPGVDWRALVTP